MKTVKEVLRMHCNWDLLVFTEGSKIRVFDVDDFLSNSLMAYLKDRFDCVCNYVMFGYGNVNLIIISLMTVDEQKFNNIWER